MPRACPVFSVTCVLDIPSCIPSFLPLAAPGVFCTGNLDLPSCFRFFAHTSMGMCPISLACRTSMVLSDIHTCVLTVLSSTTVLCCYLSWISASVRPFQDNPETMVSCFLSEHFRLVSLRLVAYVFRSLRGCLPEARTMTQGQYPNELKRRRTSIAADMCSV